MTTPATFLERLARTGLGQQLLAEEAAEALAHRKELVAEVERLTAEYEAKLPALQDAEAKALAAVERAREKLRAAQEVHGQTVVARTHASNSYNGHRGRLEGELYTTAPKAIAEFRGEMQTLHDSLRRGHFQVMESRRDALGRKVADAANPYEALAARLAAVRQAMRQAEVLMLEALDSDELAERLEALGASTSA